MILLIIFLYLPLLLLHSYLLILRPLILKTYI